MSDRKKPELPRLSPTQIVIFQMFREWTCLRLKLEKARIKGNQDDVDYFIGLLEKTKEALDRMVE